VIDEDRAVIEEHALHEGAEALSKVSTMGYAECRLLIKEAGSVEEARRVMDIALPRGFSPSDFLARPLRKLSRREAIFSVLPIRQESPMKKCPSCYVLHTPADLPGRLRWG